MADIKFQLESVNIQQGTPIRGTVLVSYPGRYDGVVVNAQVLDSNYHIKYTSSGGRVLSGSLTRLFIPRSEMEDNRTEFTAEADFEADHDYEVKFRVSIIEQHKEIESAVIFIKYRSA